MQRWGEACCNLAVKYNPAIFILMVVVSQKDRIYLIKNNYNEKVGIFSRRIDANSMFCKCTKNQSE